MERSFNQHPEGTTVKGGGDFMRHEVIHDNKGLAFGNDHACGEFLQIWRRPTNPKERKEQDMYGPDDEDMLVNKDTLFDKDFNRREMLRLIELHGFKSYELETVKRRWINKQLL